MTQSYNQGGDQHEVHRPGSSIVRDSVVILILAIAVVAGIGAYGAGFLAPGGTLRAQEPTRESAAFYTVEGPRITVPATSPLRVKLGIAEVTEKSIQRSLTLPAVVEADPARTVKVLAPVIGRVVDLKVQLGKRVAAGDELAMIDSGDLAQAIADDEKARSALKLTKQILDRLLELEKYSAVSAKDREQAQSDYAQAQAESERAQSRLRAIGVPADQNPSSRLLSLKAPVAGSIIDLQIAQGAYINDSTAAVMTIANLDTVWVTANVPEKDTALVTSGQSVDVVLTAYPNEVFKGRVLFISDVLDPDTRRTKVRIEFANPNLRLKPNMFANATFLARQEAVPMLPLTALILKNESDRVFVEVAPWVFEARPVEVAFQEGDEAVIAKGVKAGERIVVKGGVLLDD